MSNFEAIKSMQERVITSPTKSRELVELDNNNEDELYQFFLKLSMIFFMFFLLGFTG